MSEKFDADYFLCGKESGKSLYQNYRWMPDLTIPMVEAIVEHCGILKGEWVLDYGCARGYTVKALDILGYHGMGYDISKWAIENCDPEVKGGVSNDKIILENTYAWAIAKDVLEHIENVDSVIDLLMNQCSEGVFVVVPLSHNGETYDVEEYDKDITHIHRKPLAWWVGHFHRPGWSVESRYRLHGVKDNYSSWPRGNGFITCRRLD